MPPGITAPTVQQNQYTFRPRTFGLNATYRHRALAGSDPRGSATVSPA